MTDNQAPSLPPQPYRIWVLEMPFKKSGFPVVGSFGRSTRNVVIMDIATWTRLCADVPQLQKTQFEVGSYDEIS